MKIKLRSIANAAMLIEIIIILVLLYKLISISDIPYFRCFMYAILGIALGSLATYMQYKLPGRNAFGLYPLIVNVEMAIYILFRLL